jgi:uncharacterized membrane protein YcfT
MEKSEKSRIDWVDYSKGICIILVVMMHTTLGVERVTGELNWLHPFIDWAKPFRMPDFFLISGLFLAARINKPWLTYLDTKFVHFAYFYILWMTILLLTKAFGIYQVEGPLGVLTAYAMGFIEPYGTLWFIYLLAIFFVVTKATRQIPPLLIFMVAAALEIATIETGWMVLDEFASRFVYFFAGYWMAKPVFEFATKMATLSGPSLLSALIIWAAGNFALVHYGYSDLPILSLALGFIGAGAVISAGVLLAKTNLANAIRYCGENTIVIYLAFSLFMGPTRAAILRLLPSLDHGLASLC